MERWRYIRALKVLEDYPNVDKYIEKIEESIRTPHKQEDVNSDIKGTRTDNDTMFGTLWTIDTDMRLANFKRQKRIVSKLLDECGKETEIIINELCIRKSKRYRLQGLIDSGLIHVSYSTAKRLKKNFIEELDRELDL